MPKTAKGGVGRVQFSRASNPEVKKSHGQTGGWTKEGRPEGVVRTVRSSWFSSGLLFLRDIRKHFFF